MQLTDYLLQCVHLYTHLYIHFLSVVFWHVFWSWSLLSRSFEITLRPSTLGRIFRTSDQTLRPEPDNHNIHKRETSMSSVGFQHQSQQANGRRPKPYSARTQASVSQKYTHSTQKLPEKIIKHKTMKPISNSHNYIKVHEKQFYIPYSMSRNRRCHVCFISEKSLPPII